jgi:hypothetical protein
MQAKFLIAALAVAAAASGVARADDADASSQFAIKIAGQRTRAEVMAEAQKVPAARSLEPAGSRVLVAPKSGVSMQAVRADTIEAMRLGKIPSGEASF